MDMNAQKTAISWQVFRRLLSGIKLFLKSPAGGRAKLLLAVLLLLMLCINAMNVANSYVGRYFMSAIERRDVDGFVWYAWLYAGVFGVLTVVAVFFRFAEERLGLLWRDWLTHRVVGNYIDQRIYLYLGATEGLTNPDQRMSEDVRQLTTTTLSFVLMILNSTVTAISFSGVLWSISPTLFVVAVLYAAAGSALTIWLGRPLIRLNYQQSDFEADFRSELIQVRENAEGIAMTGNQGPIRGRLMTRIDQLVSNLRRITAVNRNLNFFTTGYNYMIQLIPTLLVAPLFMRHGVEFGVIGQSAMAFATLLAAFSLIVTQFQAISTYASVVTRLSEFVDAAEKAVAREANACVGCSCDADRFIFTDLTLCAADEEGTVLVNNLNTVFDPGRRILVHGDNQGARLALFRASAGVYDVGSGIIQRPSPTKLAFLPEQPYFPSGTVRELIVPKEFDGSVTNQDIAHLFEEIGLVSSKFKTLEDFERLRNWHDALSLRKLQLLSVARAVLAKPEFVLCDRLEATLGEQPQKQVLEVLKRRGITCVCFSEDNSDATQFDAALELKNGGAWEWRERCAA